LTIALSAALLVDLATVPRIVSWAGGRARHGDRNHARVVARIEQLQGTVLCPDDPTITLFAGRDPGRSLDCELDAVAQRFVPTYLEADIRNADWLVRVHATWDAHLTGVDMHGWGYRRVTDPAFDGTVYSLWRRERD
jgi:hypothetical protein